MPITVSGTSITFNDATVQTTAAAGGFSGSTTTSSAVDITLTSASTQTQVVSMTAAGKSVNLPSATTLTTKGGSIYIIQNKGQFPFFVKNNAGTVVAGPVNYGQSVQMVLTDNSTAAGTWSYSSQTAVASIGPVNLSTISNGFFAATAFGQYSTFRIAAMSSTQAIIFYNTGTSGTVLTAVLATISGSTVTYGTPVTVVASMAGSVSASVMTATSLSSTLAVVTYSPSPGTAAAIVAVSLSGSTITAGSPISFVSSVVQSPLIVYADTATTGIISYASDNGANNIATVNGFSVAGTTITLGTPANLLSTTTGSNVLPAPLVRLSAGLFTAVYNNPGTAVASARTISLSGNTVTLNAQTSYTTYDNFNASSQFAGTITGGLAATSTCAVYSIGYRYYIINVSGTSISSVVYGVANTAPSAVGPIQGAVPSNLGSGAALFIDGAGVVWAFTGNASQYGGTTFVGSTNGLFNSLSSAQLDSTTNLVTGWSNGFLASCVVKAL